MSDSGNCDVPLPPEQGNKQNDSVVRTRIASAIMDSCHGVFVDDAVNAADAVIRELEANCIYRYACAHCGDFWFDKSERMQRFALLHGKAHTYDR